MVQAALSTIRDEGVRALTLRGVGARLGVSRTALYRHFTSKAALLARVASEGFRLLDDTLTRAAANSSAEPGDTLQVMAAAYVHFALANPSHYETMFGGHLTEWEPYPELIENADRTFDRLVTAVKEAQDGGLIHAGDPVAKAEIIWSLTHGVATLALAKHLPRTPVSVEELAVQGAHFLQAGMGATAW
jgi:AcrR family transcriptional regulator